MRSDRSGAGIPDAEYLGQQLARSVAGGESAVPLFLEICFQIAFTGRTSDTKGAKLSTRV